MYTSALIALVPLLGIVAAVPRQATVVTWPNTSCSNDALRKDRNDLPSGECLNTWPGYSSLRFEWAAQQGCTRK